MRGGGLTISALPRLGGKVKDTIPPHSVPQGERERDPSRLVGEVGGEVSRYLSWNKAHPTLLGRGWAFPKQAFNSSAFSCSGLRCGQHLTLVTSPPPSTL